MKLNCFSWAVLALGALFMSACTSSHESMWGDIGSGNDMTRAQELSRENRPPPRATELPPGLGEDLPESPPATMPSMAISSP